MTYQNRRNTTERSDAVLAEHRCIYLHNIFQVITKNPHTTTIHIYTSLAALCTDVATLWRGPVKISNPLLGIPTMTFLSTL